jgi:signal transduction histidine kinase
LRTPLAAIRATVESVLMIPKLEETEARETLQVVKRQNLRLSNLVADLLMLCRIDAQLTAFGQSSQFQECICINDLIKELAEDFAALALASHIQFSIKIFTSEPLKIIGNYEQLYRLVSNIIVNALQYTSTGGRVTLILKRSNHYAFIGVKDTGIGISPEEQVKIFDRFYRVNPSRQIGGSGLGLSIAAAIAQTHRGKIEVQSQLGKGSKFTIWLPMSRDLK